MSLLPRALILRLQEAAVKARLHRETLLGGINPRFRAGLPETPNLAAQLLSDLSGLNEAERLLDGSVPLAQWLENAIALAGARVESDVFREALDALNPTPHKTAPTPPKAGPVKILFLGANPSNLTERALGRELREIGERLRAAELGDRFDLEVASAVRASDLQQCLLMHKPTIVHFSGHGSAEGQIILEDRQGRAFPVNPNALATTFKILHDNIRFVVLNAAASKEQAQAIAQHIDCVVRMTKAVGDAPAITFSGALYQGLGFGRSVQEAFELGCNQLDMEALAEADVPELTCREGVRAADVTLVSPG
jgi:hypothetical protein